MSTNSTTPRHFDDSYREEIELKDGKKAVLRIMRPEDKEAMRRGFERLSPESRFLRFFSPKAKLTDRDLKYLTEVDGEDHFAMVALTEVDGAEEGLGVARFVRLEREYDVAEPAITVIDEAQGSGLGTMLLHKLSAAASERGIRRFRCEFLVHNERMRAILEDMAEDVEFQSDGDVVRAEFRLPHVDPVEELPAGYALLVLLGQVAEGAGRLLPGMSVFEANAAPEDIEDLPAARVTKILAPIDFSPTSAAALNYAITLAKVFGASLEILHVWQPPVFGSGRIVTAGDGGSQSLYEWSRVEARRRLDVFLAGFTAISPDLEGRLEPGEPVDAILAVATDVGADLIVLGTHGRSGFTRVLMGSVAEKTLRTSTCPVLTVPTPPRVG